MSDHDEIRETLDLESWFETEGVAFKMGRGSSGMQINAQECPKCGDRRWRVYINAETGLGNCFVCDEGFNKTKFIGLTVGLEKHALSQYMRAAAKDQGWKPKRTTVMDVDFGEIKLPMNFALPTSDGRNLVYLENRGIDAETARYFKLAYCDEGWWNFIDDEGRRSGQKFDSRILLPVFDLDGKLVTFQGRDVTGTSEKKYLFPRQLPGTGRYLYNGQNAIRSPRIAIGEGAFDVMALKKAFDSVVDVRDVVPVGTFGKHLSFGAIDGDDQLSRFLRLKGQGLLEVTIMWDGEWKALVSALDAARKLRGIGLAVKIAKLPKDRDPNEVIPEVVVECFYKAVPYSPRLDVQWRMRDPYA